VGCAGKGTPSKTDRIEAVLFDFGGVLAEEGFREGLYAIGRQSGKNPEVMAGAGLDLVHRTGYAVGRAGEEVFWDRLRREAGAVGTDQELRNEILSRFTLRPWMIRVVEELRAKGLILGILSDQTGWLDEINRDYGFFRHFHHVFNSYHTGISKKDPTAFDLAARRMGVPPLRILFVDDDPGNVERARGRGMKAVLYSERESFLEDMSSRGLLDGHSQPERSRSGTARLL
jgi:putative hydrolase of the HAD superfamily